MGAPLRVGCVKYLNARPLICGWAGPVDFDNPSALCAKLAAAELDVALVSSLEYLRHPIYRIVDDVSIAANGPVYSVIVAHQTPLPRVSEIQLDPASQTSVALLRVLLAEKRLSPKMVSLSVSSTRTSAKLLIGDQAIRFRAEHGDRLDYWDLADEWRKITDLPFVFALWLIRPETAEAKSIAERLRRIRDHNFDKITEVARSQSEFPVDFCKGYYRKNLSFEFGQAEKAGLLEFHRRCLEIGVGVAPSLALDLV